MKLNAQIVRDYGLARFDPADYRQFGTNKVIPEDIEPQVLFALSHYPELKDARIIFRMKQSKTPLTSRPKVLSTFRQKGNRTYVITISTRTKDFLTPILLANLPFNAQVGVLGHELAHITDYRNKSSSQLIGLAFNMLGKSYVDRFEYNTDKITIEHGLGYQLLDWSSFVRKALNIDQWRGASETGNNQIAIDQRYMNPKTIKRFIDSYPAYR